MKFKEVIGYVTLFLSTFLLDRISKDWIVHHVELPQQLNRFFSLDLVINRGISWGLFHSQDSLRFIVITGLVVLISILLTVSLIGQAQKGYAITGQILVLSGALSNLVDRYYYHGVVDFIIFSVKNWSWPVFNVADCLIVIGITIIIYQYWKST